MTSFDLPIILSLLYVIVFLIYDSKFSMADESDNASYVTRVTVVYCRRQMCNSLKMNYLEILLLLLLYSFLFYLLT